MAPGSIEEFAKLAGYASVAGVTVIIGGLLARANLLPRNELGEEISHGLVAFGGGVLVAAVAFVLTPTGRELLALPVLTLTFLGGAVSVFLLDRLDDAWKPLVTRVAFKAAHHALRGNSFAVAHPRRVASPYLLSGMLRCGRCSASMMGQPAKSGRFHYYVCGTAFRKGRRLCEARPIRKELIESLVLDKVRSIILQKEHVIELVRLTNEELRSSLGGIEDRVAQLRAQRVDVEARLGRLYDALETGQLELGDVGTESRGTSTPGGASKPGRA